MSNFFSYDSPLMRVLTKVADLMVLNLVALVCCIPIITIGPSITALHYVSLKLVRDEESHIIKAFFRSFKSNFRQATIIWMIFLVFITFFIMDYYIIKSVPMVFPQFIKILLLVMFIMIAMIFCYVFPVLSKFSNSIYQTMKNAAIMSIVNFPKTVLMLIMYILPIYATYRYPKLVPINFFLGLTGPIYLTALLYNGIFKKLEDKVLASSQSKEKAEEDTTEKGSSEQTSVDHEMCDNTDCKQD